MPSVIQKLKRNQRISLFKSCDEKNVKAIKATQLVPVANVDENESEYIITLAAPGFDKNAFKVNIENDTISISACKEPPDKNCTHDRLEYDYSCWERGFPLPGDADALMARACYVNGELLIRIPRGNRNYTPTLISVYVY